MKFLDQPTTEKAKTFLGKETIFCVMSGIMKKPSKDVNKDGEVFYRFNIRTTSKDGFSQTFTCVVPAIYSVDVKEKEFMDMKNKEILIIPSLSNQLNEWKGKNEGDKGGINNRLTLYVSRMAVIGEGESNKTYDDEIGVNW